MLKLDSLKELFVFKFCETQSSTELGRLCHQMFALHIVNSTVQTTVHADFLAVMTPSLLSYHSKSSHHTVNLRLFTILTLTVIYTVS